MRKTRWCLYALGGGLGHVSRAVALARAAVTQGHEVVLLANSPYAELLPIAEELGGTGRLIALPPSASPEQTAASVKRLIPEIAPDVLVVDTFPRGLAGELADLIPELDIKKVLVHRDLNPRYVAQARLNEFVNFYDLLLLPGEGGPLSHHSTARSSPPWLLRDSTELLSRDAALTQLKIDATSRPVIAVLATGKSDEIAAMRELAGRISSAVSARAVVRCIAPHAVTSAEISLWPCLAAMAGIDLLVGSGGYNTVWEARSTQTPLVAIIRQRLYDMQHVRLTAAERVEDETAALERVCELMKSGSIGPRRGVPAYENGVHAAVRWIEERATAAP